MSAAAPLDARTATRRFVVLTVLRWLPVGLVIPVVVLLPLDRGLSLAEVGVAFAAQGVAVLLLELPTGGLADSAGRRPVAIAAGVVGIASTVLVLAAHTPLAFAVAFALQGAFRALDSGPLEAWYVDALLAAEPGARIEKGLSAQGVAAGAAIGAGSLAGGGLVAIAPGGLGVGGLWVGGLEALAVPVAASLALQAVALLAVVALMAEPRRRADGRGPLAAVAATPRAIARGAGLLRRDRVLLALVAVEASWGFGIVAFESLTPVRLAELVGDDARAAAVFGPAAAAAWIAAAGGAAALPALSRRGVAAVAAALRLTQGLTVVGIGLLGGVPAMLTAYLACYLVHGASGTAHSTLLHRQVTGEARATVVSLNSMVMHPAAALGSVVLTALAERSGTGAAMVLAAVVLAAAAPLYVPAWRAEKVRAAAAVAGRA